MAVIKDDREEVLANIAKALSSRGSVPPSSFSAPAAERDMAPRGDLTADQTVELFSANITANAAHLRTIAAERELPSAVRLCLRESGLPDQVVLGRKFSGLAWQDEGIDAHVRDVSGTDQAGITDVFCAIAQTGTLLLASGPAHSISASLLPYCHIAVLERRRVLRTLGDACRLLLKEHDGVPPRNVSFVSGPSRTSDIEQQSVLGAHGPKHLHVILVG